MKNIILHQVTCTQDEIECMWGKNEKNIRKSEKLRKNKNSSFSGASILDLDLNFPSLDLDLYLIFLSLLKSNF